jgi:hypothetical protein
MSEVNPKATMGATISCHRLMTALLGAPISAHADAIVLPGSATQAMDWGAWLLEMLAIVFIGKLLFWLAGLLFVGLHVALLAMIAWGLIKGRFWRAGLLTCGGGLLLGYGALACILAPAQSPAPGPSSDWSVVEQGLAIDLRPQSARWEAFATPEVDARLPAPTDMESLVAELTLSPQDAARLSTTSRSPSANSSIRWVVAPNSARPWLTPTNQDLLGALAAAEAQQPSQHADNCQPIAARGRQSGQDKVAFICVQGHRALLHVVLSGP